MLPSHIRKRFGDPGSYVGLHRIVAWCKYVFREARITYQPVIAFICPRAVKLKHAP
jgi:hypothetical protein